MRQTVQPVMEKSCQGIDQENRYKRWQIHNGRHIAMGKAVCVTDNGFCNPIALLKPEPETPGDHTKHDKQQCNAQQHTGIEKHKQEKCIDREALERTICLALFTVRQIIRVGCIVFGVVSKCEENKNAAKYNKSAKRNNEGD